jgi:hypothetical protein
MDVGQAVTARREQRSAVYGPGNCAETAVRDAVYVGVRKPGERLAVEQGYRRAVFISDRQPCSVRRAESDGVRLAAEGVDRYGGMDRPLQVGGIEPQLTVKCGLASRPSGLKAAP